MLDDQKNFSYRANMFSINKIIYVHSVSHVKNSPQSISDRTLIHTTKVWILIPSSHPIISRLVWYPFRPVLQLRYGSANACHVTIVQDPGHPGQRASCDGQIGAGDHRVAVDAARSRGSGRTIFRASGTTTTTVGTELEAL